MRTDSLVVPVALAALAALGMFCEDQIARSLECADSTRVQEIVDVHYEDLDCEAAIRSAESRLTAAYYRKACEQLAPDQGVPPAVSDAWVSHCQAASDDAGGSVLDVRVCCP